MTTYDSTYAEKFQLTTHYWSMISSLLHLVGLRPRVYYTLTNFRGGGGARPSWPPPQYANVECVRFKSNFIFLTFVTHKIRLFERTHKNPLN